MADVEERTDMEDNLTDDTDDTTMVIPTSSSSVPTKRYRYRVAWEAEEGRKVWLTGSPGEAKAFCKVCNRSLRAHLSDIKKHGGGSKHRRRVDALLGVAHQPSVISTKSPLLAKLAAKGLSGLSTSSTGNTVYKYDKRWEEEEQFADWLDRSLDGESALCHFCHVELRPKYSDLKRHAATSKHVKAAAISYERMREEAVQRAAEDPHYFSTNSAALASSNALCNKKKELELRISLCLGVSSLMMGVSDWCAMLQTMLGQQVVRMTGLECVNLFNVVVANHFKVGLKSEIENAYYAIIIDDVQRMSLLGQVAVCVRYFSRRRGKVTTVYLGKISALNLDPEGLASALTHLLLGWNLSLNRLVSVCVDGVNFEQCTEVAQSLSTRTSPNVCVTHSSTVTIGKVIEQAFIKANLPHELAVLLRQSYNWFAERPSRQLHHSELVERLGFVGMGSDSCLVYDRTEGDERLKPISSHSSKWLAIGEYIGKIVQHYDELLDFFRTKACKEACSEAYLLVTVYNKQGIRPLLCVLQPFLEKLSSIQSISGWSGIRKVADVFFEVAKIVLEDQNNSQDVDQLFGESRSFAGQEFRDSQNPEVQRVIAKFWTPLELDNDMELLVTTHALNFLIELFKGLQSVLKESTSIARSKEELGEKCLLKDDTTPNPIDQRLFLPAFFPDQSEENLKLLSEKLKLMRMLEWKNANGSSSQLWNEVHEFGDATGNFPLRPISDGVLKMLCVPVFEADVDAAFAIINTVTSDCRDRLDDELIDSILHARFGLSASGNRGVAGYKFPAAMTQSKPVDTEEHNDENNRENDDISRDKESVHESIEMEFKRRRSRRPKTKCIRMKKGFKK